MYTDSTAAAASTRNTNEIMMSSLSAVCRPIRLTLTLTSLVGRSLSHEWQK